MSDFQDEQDVRLLINDTDEEDPLFSDDEIASFLRLEGENVKRAAAQALDTIADNEVLVAKVITDHQLSTQGDRVAKSLRDRATALRAQADVEDEDADGFDFEIVGGC